MDSILPRDLIGLTLSYLPPYMEDMVRSLDEPTPWELQRMASRGLVANQYLSGWAIIHGLPYDERFICNKAFYGCPLYDNDITDRMLYAAAAGRGNCNYLDYLIDMHSSVRDETIHKMCDIIVKREHLDTMAEILDSRSSRLKETLLRDTLPRARNERFMDLYVEHVSREMDDTELRDVMYAANGPLLKKLMKEISSLDLWYDLFSLMAIWPHPEIVAAILEADYPVDEEMALDAFAFSDCSLEPLVAVMRREEKAFARAFVARYG